MTEVFQIILVIVPAALVLFGMYLSINSFLAKQADIKTIELKAESQKVTLPLQLQAYERVLLLLERISPNNLLTRINGSNFSARDFHRIIVSEIREEFNHNLSQQIYITDEAWFNVKNSVESTISAINEAAAGLDENATGIDLSKKILNYFIQQPYNIVEGSILKIKAEVRDRLL